MSMLMFDCDNVNSASVANPLSNEELNDSNTSTLASNDELIVFKDAVVAKVFPNDDVYAWNEPVVTNPVPAATTPILAAIDALIAATSTSVARIDSELLNDVLIMVITDCEKSVPICALVDNAEPLSICFNLIKFAISYKYR